MEHIETVVRAKKFNLNTYKQFLDSLGSKDIDLGVFESVSNILMNNNCSFNDLLNNFGSDQNFVPFIIHENFIEYIEKNTKNTYNEKLDLCLEYYDNLSKSQIIKNNLFGNWDLKQLKKQLGITSCIAPNIILKKAKLKDIAPFQDFEKSALISKYNYRYYNLKSINHICKKLDIDINNFQIIALFAVYNTFIDRTNIEYLIRYFKNKNLSFKEYEKLMKLSSIFEDFTKKYTKKIQKEINTLFDKI